MIDFAGEPINNPAVSRSSLVGRWVGGPSRPWLPCGDGFGLPRGGGFGLAVRGGGFGLVAGGGGDAMATACTRRVLMSVITLRSDCVGQSIRLLWSMYAVTCDGSDQVKRGSHPAVGKTSARPRTG